MSSRSSKNPRRPRRTTAWSSTSRTRIRDGASASAGRIAAPSIVESIAATDATRNHAVPGASMARRPGGPATGRGIARRRGRGRYRPGGTREADGSASGRRGGGTRVDAAAFLVLDGLVAAVRALAAGGGQADRA